MSRFSRLVGDLPSVLRASPPWIKDGAKIVLLPVGASHSSGERGAGEGLEEENPSPAGVTAREEETR